MRTIEISRELFGEPVTLLALPLDGGIHVSLFGGSRPHIGAVSIADMDGYVTTTQFPFHKESVISHKWAGALARLGRLPVVVEVGIHYDGLDEAGIQKVLALADALLKEVSAALVKPAQRCTYSEEHMKHTALIFDLDGVLVDTAKYHYLAWKQLADELGIPFSEKENERFKGVSRARCMEILLELGGRTMTEEEKTACTDKKNSIYVNYIRNMDEREILPGVKAFLEDARENGYRIGLGSASKNTSLILERLKLAPYFDAVIDGTQVTQAKPDPQVFLRDAEALGVHPSDCIVFEDAGAGIQAAHAGGMTAVGIGSRAALPEADLILAEFTDISVTEVEQWLSTIPK